MTIRRRRCVVPDRIQAEATLAATEAAIEAKNARVMRATKAVIMVCSWWLLRCR
jgi:hypothetical protein